jgi:hypothetical protein
VEIVLEKLRRILVEPPYSQLSDRFLSLLHETRGPFTQAVWVGEGWRKFVIDASVAHEIGPQARKRLKNPSSMSRSSLPAGLFDRVKAKEPHFKPALLKMKRGVTGLAGGFRTGPVSASAGFLRQTAVFPAPNQIAPGLSQISRLLAAQPVLPSPVWDALLVQVILLRLHPFPTGNGRTARAMAAYELWRRGLIAETLIPVGPIIDANRPSSIALNAAIDVPGCADVERLVALKLAFELYALLCVVDKSADFQVFPDPLKNALKSVVEQVTLQSNYI